MTAPTERSPLIAIVGPTASGKTMLAIELALAMDGEIVNADSRQIYRWMEIGTAKPTLAERAQVPHHVIDVVEPDESFTLVDYQREATRAIADITARGRIPFLVGGTGLYIRAVLDGLAVPAAPPDLAQREQWEAEAARDGPAALHDRLAARDPVAATRIPVTNVRRVIRALEVIVATGAPFSAQQVIQPPPYETIRIGLNTTRAQLYAWADHRVDAMLAAGFIDEVRDLVHRGYDWNLPAMSSLGYREIGAVLRGTMSLPDAVQRIKWDTHGFIRKQLTWFRPDPRIHWIDCAAPDRVARARASIPPGFAWRDK